MRTNLVLDDDLLSEARQYSAAPSNRALIREALQTYVAVKAAERRRASYRERLTAVRKRTANLNTRTPAHTLIRADRERQA